MNSTGAAKASPTLEKSKINPDTAYGTHKPEIPGNKNKQTKK